MLTWSLEAVQVPTLLALSLSQIMAKSSHPPSPLKGNPDAIYTWPQCLDTFPATPGKLE